MTTPQTSEELPVLIAGAGPVGLMLAADLARRGVRVRIIDQLAAPTTESRAIVVHSRSLDHLEALGVLDEVFDRGIRSTGMEFHSDGKLIAHASFERIAATHPFSVSIPQTDTEAILATRLAALGVQVERSSTVSGYRETPDGVDVGVARGDGSEERVRASFLVGTDGARSTVRHLMGERLQGKFSGEEFLIGDVEGDHDYDRHHLHSFFSPGDTTGLLFPLPGDRVRVFTQLPDGTDPSRPATVEWLQQALDERGMDLRIRTAHWLTRFELKHGQVGRYRSGRVFLAGDAAHIHSPAGALGMNTGVQDAVNLGWKLAAALAKPSETLLDSYQAERHPIAAGVIRFSSTLSRIGTLQNPLARRARNAVLRVGLSVPAVEKRMAATIEQQHVHYRHSPVVHGRGRSLRPGDFLRLPETSLARALSNAPGHLVILLTSAGDARPLPDGATELHVSARDHATLAAATGLRDGGVVVVRPDGYIGAIGADPATELQSYFAALFR